MVEKSVALGKVNKVLAHLRTSSTGLSCEVGQSVSIDSEANESCGKITSFAAFPEACFCLALVSSKSLEGNLYIGGELWQVV